MLNLYLLIYLLTCCYFGNSQSFAEDTRKLYLKRAMGDLELYGLATDSTYVHFYIRRLLSTTCEGEI